MLRTPPARPSFRHRLHTRLHNLCRAAGRPFQIRMYTVGSRPGLEAACAVGARLVIGNRPLAITGLSDCPGSCPIGADWRA